ADCGPMLTHRLELLHEAASEVREARRLGDTSTELELTDLWIQTLSFLWRSELAETIKKESESRASPSGHAASSVPEILPVTTLRGALASLDAPAEEAVLRAAADLGKRKPTDAEALAGAADIISLVRASDGSVDALARHVDAA